MNIQTLTNIIKRSNQIFNETYYKVLNHDDLNGAVIPSLIEISLLDAFEEVFGSRVMHGDDSTGHDIEHVYFKNIAAEVKATSNYRKLSFSQNVCNGTDKFPDKDKKIPHIFIAFDIDKSSKNRCLVYKKIYVGSVAYNDWNRHGRSMYITKKTIKSNCIEITF